MNSIEYMLHTYGIRVEDRSQLRPWLGPPLVDSLMKYYQFTREQALEAVLRYREYFDDRGIFENRPYEGILPMLDRLQSMGHSLMIATSKPELAARRITDHFDMTQFFTYVGGATQDDSRVKKGDVIRYVLEKNGVISPFQAVMVGDRSHDMIGAAQNHLTSVGVLYGYGSRDELMESGASYITETVMTLEQLLGRM